MTFCWCTASSCSSCSFSLVCGWVRVVWDSHFLGVLCMMSVFGLVGLEALEVDSTWTLLSLECHLPFRPLAHPPWPPSPSTPHLPSWAQAPPWVHSPVTPPLTPGTTRVTWGCASRRCFIAAFSFPSITGAMSGTDFFIPIDIIISSIKLILHWLLTCWVRAYAHAHARTHVSLCFGSCFFGSEPFFQTWWDLAHCHTQCAFKVA